MNQPTTKKTFYEFNQADNHAQSSVILIHGLAASLYDWVDLIPELSRAGYLSYALDLLGHGKSHKPENINEYNIENVFLSFCQWIESLQISWPAIVIGHSLGAYLALKYTLLYPEHVTRLILCDPFYTIDQLPLLLRLNYRYSLIDTTLIRFIPEWLIRWVVDLTSISIRNGYVLPDDVRRQTAADYKRARPEIFNILQSIRDLTPFVSAIHQPTLVIWGEKDGTLQPSYFSKIVKTIPNAIGVEIKGAGHVPHQSHSKEFNQQIMSFLQNNHSCK